MDDEGPQSEGTQTADLMDFMDSSDLGDSETSNDGSQAADQDSSPEDTPQESAEPGHPREDAADEFEEELADEPVAVTPDAQGTSEAPSWEPTAPFTYSLGHQTHEINGAVKGADGVVYIPPESVEEVQRLVSRGRWHEENYVRERQQMERRIKDAENKYDENAVKAKASAEFFDKLANSAPEQIVEFLSNWRINRPQVIAAQERAQAQELYRRAQEAQQGDPQENAYRQQETKSAALTQVVTNYAQQPQYQFMTNEDWNRFHARLQRNQGQLFTVADKDYGPHETTNGIGVQKGALALNTGWLNEETHGVRHDSSPESTGRPAARGAGVQPAAERHRQTTRTANGR